MTSQQLVLDHLGLAAGIAGKMSKRLPRYIDPRDLEQDARIGLMDAAAKFDGSRRVSFGAYARRRIGGAIIDGIRRTDHLSRDARAKHRAEGSDAPAAPLHLDGGDEIPGVLLSPEHHAVASERNRVIEDAVATLPRRWRIVLRSYYHAGRTMREIGAGMGVNESRVSQIHKSALRRLREHLVARGVTTAAQFNIQEVRP